MKVWDTGIEIAVKDQGAIRGDELGIHVQEVHATLIVDPTAVVGAGAVPVLVAIPFLQPFTALVAVSNDQIGIGCIESGSPRT